MKRQLNRKIKYALLITLGVIVTMCALGVIAYQRRERLLTESPFFQELNAAEQHGDFASITTRLLEKSQKVGKSEARLITFWLQKRGDEGRFPALYLISLFYSKQGRMSEAAKWYSAAALIGRVDVARSGDPTAGGALHVIEMQFSPIKDYLTKNQGEKKKGMQWALDREEKMKTRVVAPWISGHGIKAFEANGHASNSDPEQARATIRAEFEKAMSAS